MYNHCYNKRALVAHNEKRLLHEARALTTDRENGTMAKEIQRILNELPRGEAVEMPAASQRAAAYRECGENVYTTSTLTEAGRLSLFTTDAATDGWYAGSAQYDFAAHRPTNAGVTQQSDQFT
jgi:hypothetical protein